MVKQKWMVAAKKADFEALSKKFNIDPVLARIIRNRGVISDEEFEFFLNGDMNSLHDPLLMKDMGKACDVILKAISDKKKIRIIGDYDVDGICATYILLKSLSTLGGVVDTVIPHRILDGYGLNDHLIKAASEDGIELIVTCDNGISAFDQIELANQLGIDVVVTDHHEVPYEMEGDEKRYIIPHALAVVDPKQEDDEYPFKSICGGVVAYKLISILLGEKYPKVMEELLPFAAMATVCDVMELLGENRIIVKAGLKLMNNPINPGMKALVMACGLGQKSISAYHFGFVLGPTVNATGRLDTAKRALELFSSQDFNEACVIATELREINESRKKITEDGTELASRIVEEEGMDSQKVLVIYLDNVHESIAGIIAGRIKEKYYKPTLVLTKAEEGIKGSGRSVEAYDMYEELTKIKDLFTKYGGHKMAAGVSLKSIEDVNELRRRLNENATLTQEDLVKKIAIDVPMPLSYASMGLAKSFELLEPCGTSNPRPMFATANVSLLSYAKKGRTRLIGKFRVMDEDSRSYEMVYFDDLDSFDEFIEKNFGASVLDQLMNRGCSKGEIVIKVAYSISVNEFNNMESLQIVMKNYDI